MVPATKPSRPDRTGRRRRFERAWRLIVLAWAGFRTLVVWRALGRYGVNPFAYGCVDVVSSFPYGLATARVVVSAIDRRWRAARAWGSLAAATFVAPDLYIVASGRAMPIAVYAVVGLIAITMATLATVDVVRRVRAAGRARRGRTDVAAASG